MAKVYYVGDWAVQIGPIYAETSFNHSPKGLDFFNYGKWLVAAVEIQRATQHCQCPCLGVLHIPTRRI